MNKDKMIEKLLGLSRELLIIIEAIIIEDETNTDTVREIAYKVCAIEEEFLK